LGPAFDALTSLTKRSIVSTLARRIRAIAKKLFVSLSIDSEKKLFFHNCFSLFFEGEE
jgi:hypothetical protein